jgi:hypothetical protein
VQRHGIGRQLQPISSGSTPRDRVTIPQICSSRSLALDRPRQSAPRYPPVVANRATVLDLRRDPPLIHDPLRCHTICSISSVSTNQLTRGSQISIAPAARLYVPPARFPPLEAFGRRPPNTRRRRSSGRHPKPFTFAEARCAHCRSRLQRARERWPHRSHAAWPGPKVQERRRKNDNPGQTALAG